MRTSTIIGVICVAGSLSGCGVLGLGTPGAGGIPETPLPFSSKLSQGDDPRDFLIAVNTRSRQRGAPEANPDEGISVETVRESVRFSATRYCLAAFGSSDADWTIDPETGDWAFAQAGDVLNFSGRCTAR